MGSAGFFESIANLNCACEPAPLSEFGGSCLSEISDARVPSRSMRISVRWGASGNFDRFSGLLLASTSHGEHISDYLTELATTRGERLREREASSDEIGQLFKDVRGGRAVRLHRGSEVLGRDDPDLTRVERGDLIIEILPKGCP